MITYKKTLRIEANKTPRMTLNRAPTNILYFYILYWFHIFLIKIELVMSF